MKNNLLKFYITAFFFCSTLLTFAQETPGTDDEAGTMEELDPLPIDDYIWVLIAIGLVFSFLRFRAISQQRSLQK